MATFVRCIEKPTYWEVGGPAGGVTIPRDGRWTFNGDYVNPTFSPSVNETWGKEGQTHANLAADPRPNRNHCFIRDGKIEYLSDCTHKYAGQTCELTAYPVPSERETA